MPNLLDGSSTLESPAVSTTDETSIDSTTSIQTNQTVTPPSPPPPPSAQTLGFCYSCNRRSIIDTTNYSCSNCSSGFVELIAETTSTNRNGNQNNDIELETLFENPLFRFINNLNPPEQPNRTTTTTTTTTTNAMPATETSSEPNEPGPSGPSAEQESFFSRFRASLRRNEQNRNRFRNYYTLGDNEDESSRSSSSSSRRRSRSPPILGRTSSRPFSRSRFLNYLEDDSNMLFDHGAIIITTLINQLRNRGAAPASETQIQSLPLVTVDQKLVDDSSQCAVCMDDFALNEEAKKLPCKHLFHDPCIAQWLKLHATCPVCRNNINGEEPNSQNGSNNNNLLNDNGPTFFNIIPFPDEPASSSASSQTHHHHHHHHHQHHNPSSQRRSHNLNLRNHNLYRIHIRQNLSPNDSQRTSEQSNDDPIVSRLRSGIRITTRVTEPEPTPNNTNATPTSTTNTSNNNSEPRRTHHLNLNQMMQQFMSRNRTEGISAQLDRDQNLRSSIRITTRIANPEQADSDESSRYSNMVQHLMNQFRQVDRTLNVNNRQTENNSDDDVIEIDPERTRDDSNERSSDGNLPNAKRRRV